MKSIAKTVGVVMLLTLLSRIMALFSNQFSLVHFSVDDVFMNAFTYALGLPNIVFAGIGTALTTVVVPIIAGYMEKREEKKAFSFVQNISTLTILLTSILVLLGYFVIPYLIGLTMFSQTAAHQFSILASRAMFVVMIFYGLTSIFQGVLQSAGRFIATSMVSLPGSLLVIGYVGLLGDHYGVRGLLIASIVGLSLQLIILLPSMKKIGFQFKPLLKWKEPDLVRALKLIPPVFIGSSAWQLNMLFNSTMAANFEGGVNLLTLVQNLMISGIMTIVYSVTAVIFPKLTVHYAKEEMGEFVRTFSKSIRSLAFFLVPLTVVFIFLSKEVLSLIYGYGKVTGQNIETAGLMMTFFSVGILGQSVKEVSDRAFYAVKNTLTPALNGVLIMGINILACSLLTGPMGVSGIALSYTISLTCGAMAILFLLRKKIGHLGGRSMGIHFLKLALAAVFMAFFVWVAKDSIVFTTGSVIANRILNLGVPLIPGTLAFLMVGAWLRVEEAENLIHKVRIFLKRRSA